MPYKRDGSDAPEMVRKLTAKKRRQWVAVFNSAFSKCRDGGGELSQCEGGAFAQANGVLKQQTEVVMPEIEEVTKTVDGEQYPSGDFLVVEDPEMPDTWHLQVKKNGVPDRGLAGAAWAALFNPSGYRGNPYEGPMKGEAQDKLKALYDSEEWEQPARESEPTREMDLSGVLEHLQQAMDALKAMGMPDGEEPEMPSEEPEAPMESAEMFAESAAPPIKIVEASEPVNRRSPLNLEVGLIRVGPGNSRDKHYYTRELLERDGVVFKGLTMHTVDHREDQRRETTDVSVIEDILGVREMADGEYLVGLVKAYDPDFCEKTRNRADAGHLDKLQCSILASGEAKPGKVGEQDYNVVQRITEGRFVDWVTRAGAGGHALQIAESAAEPEPEQEILETEAQPVTLSEDEPQAPKLLELSVVVTELGKTNLPAASVAELSRSEYADIAEIQRAITAEVARLKANGSGQPVGVPAEVKQKPRNLAEIQAEMQAVNRKYLGGM